MFHTPKQYRIVRSYPGYGPINLGIIRVLLRLLMMLLLATASAAPTSALINETIQQSSGKPSPEQSVINPAAVIEDTKKKLVVTSEELALLPSEAVAGSPATGSSGEVVNIFARRLHLRQLVFLFQGQFTRLASLQVRQQHRLELESQTANWSGFSQPSLHPFLRADELKESVTKLGSRVDELESWISALDQAGAQVINIAENSTVKLSMGPFTRRPAFVGYYLLLGEMPSSRLT